MPDDAANTLEATFEAAVKDEVAWALGRLAWFMAEKPISSDPAHRISVTYVAEWLKDALIEDGFEAKIIRIPEAHPLVSAYLHAGDDKPTILVYGHGDVQPVDQPGWDTDPFTLTLIGDRVYGRGSSDDMGGWLSHWAAIRAYRRVYGALPCNIRFVIEFEEEIGSPNLEAYMHAYPEAFQGDAMILTDSENRSEDVPGITISLRGVCQMTVTVKALERGVHSGLGGNIVPNPVLALMQCISAVVDAKGRLIEWLLYPVPGDAAQRAAAVGLTAAEVAHEARLIAGAKVPPDGPYGRSLAEWAWLQPAVTVLSTDIPHESGNVIHPSASAVLSVRLAPWQSGNDLRMRIDGALRAATPYGVVIETAWDKQFSVGWYYNPPTRPFAAVDRAFEQAWGVKPAYIGVGGTIPFVALFGKLFGDRVPLILTGVMDPGSGAHGPNESLHLGVFEKAIKANARMYYELSQPGVLDRAG